MVTSDQIKQQYELIEPFPATFVIPFIYWEKEGIKAVISRTSGDEELTPEIDFTATYPGTNGGTLTRLTEWTGAKRLTIYRELPAVQDADFRNNARFRADVLERALDRIVALIQQSADTLKRTIRFPVSDTEDVMTMPAQEERKGKFLGFDENGMPVAATMMLPRGAIRYFRTTIDQAGPKIIPIASMGITGNVTAVSVQLVGNHRFVRNVGAVVDAVDVVIHCYYDTYPYTLPQEGAPSIKAGTKQAGTFKVGGMAAIELDLILFGEEA